MHGWTWSRPAEATPAFGWDWGVGEFVAGPAQGRVSGHNGVVLTYYGI